MLYLDGSRRDMVLVDHTLLFGRRSGGESARTPCVAHPIDGDVVDHRLAVDVLNLHVGDVGDLTVVIKAVTPPIAALITMTRITETVDHSSVETDLRRPVTRRPDEKSLRPAPVPRRPEKSDRGWFDPGAGNPVVAIRPVIPVAGHPDVIRRGYRRLFVHWNRWRGD